MDIHNNKRLRAFSLGIKENTKLLSLIGLCFFIASVIFGIIWLINSYNSKLEPVTFVLGACATIFFGLPQLAEYILPSRKPIRHMNYDELVGFILQTDPKNDWHSVDREWTQERFLKEDPRLRFIVNIGEEGTENNNFVEPWANKHSDPHAVSYYYDLLFDGNFIHRLILVSVDGHRAVLPIPKALTNIVRPFQHKVAEIFDSQNSLEVYMTRAGLTKQNYP